MDEGDREWFRQLLDDKLSQLPCNEHTVKITQIETRQQNGKEFAVQTATEKQKDKDWLIKLAMVAIGIITLLNALGYIQTMGK